MINLSDYFVIRPALVGLLRSTERITLVDMYKRQARSMSVKAMATPAVIETVAFMASIMNWLLLPRPNLYMLVAALCLGAAATYFSGMLCAKLRMEPAPT